MSNIHFDLTPPPKLTELALLSPTSFLNHETIQNKLKRRTSQLLSSPQVKKMALCPPMTANDRTMNGYCDRITAEAIATATVVLPVEEVTTKMNSSFNVLQLKISDLETRLGTRYQLLEKMRLDQEAMRMDQQSLDQLIQGIRMDQESQYQRLEKMRLDQEATKADALEMRESQYQRLEKMRLDQEAMRLDQEATKADALEMRESQYQRLEKMRLDQEAMRLDQEAMRMEHETSKAKALEMEIARISAFGANLLGKFMDKVEKTGKRSGKETDMTSSDSDVPLYSVTRYTRAAEAFDESIFKTTGLPDIGFRLLRGYPQLIQARNQCYEYAYETRNTFAELLMKEEHRRLYYLWSPFVEFCCNKSVEELAELAEQAQKPHMSIYGDLFED